MTIIDYGSIGITREFTPRFSWSLLDRVAEGNESCGTRGWFKFDSDVDCVTRERKQTTIHQASARVRIHCYPARDEPPTEHMASRPDYAVNIAIAAAWPVGGRRTGRDVSGITSDTMGKGWRFLNGAPPFPCFGGNECTPDFELNGVKVNRNLIAMTSELLFIFFNRIFVIKKNCLVSRLICLIVRLLNFLYVV